METQTSKYFISSSNPIKQEQNSSATIDQLITLEQFIELSNQIKVKAERRQQLIKSIYTPNYYQREFKYTRKNQKERSQYQQLYRNWKNQQEKQCTFDSTYKSTLALLDKEKRESQLKRLVSQNKMAEPIYKYQQKNPYFKTKLTTHQQTLKQSFKTQVNFKQQHEIKQNTSIQSVYTELDQKQKVKAIQAAINLQLLQRIREINQKQQKQRQRQLKQQQMEKLCFVEFIERPNLILSKKVDAKQVFSKKQQIKRQQAYQIEEEINEKIRLEVGKKQKHRAYKVNVEEILKIKPKQYLIFYSDNYHQILRLASPEQMKQLNKYRDQCWKKQEALKKLKQKVSQYGPQYIHKLSPSSRQKLFKLLYQQDLEIQKSYHA